MGYIEIQTSQLSPLIRPALLIEAARIGARRYHRFRDLPGALPGALPGTLSGLGAKPREQIVGRLLEAECDWELLRRCLAPAYRPAKHVQVLAAYLAEAATIPPDNLRRCQTKASGSAALRSAI